MNSVFSDLESDVGAEPVRAKKVSGGNGHSGVSKFDAANGAVSTIAVLDALGIDHDEKHHKCIGCGEDGALICKDGGSKCLHNRCAGVGPSGFPGYRSNVDLVAESQHIDPTEAVVWLAERFGIELHKSKNDNVKDDFRQQQSPRSVAASIDDAIALVCRRQSHEEEPVPVPFYDYAKALDGGLWSGVEVLISTTGGLKTQLAVQKLWHVAKQGIPCLYVTLELTVIEATIRLLAQVAGVSWSTAMKGQLSPDAFARFQAAGAELATLPIEIKRGAPYRFSSDDLAAVVTEFRIAHPEGRAYAVVDFAQLLKCSQVNAEARERVGQVLYSMQILAKEKNVVITAISSTARANNLGLADIKKFADLRFEDGQKIVGNPMALLSLGKEAGEVELAAEYQLVMAKWPEKTYDGFEIIIGAIAKYRLNRCRWFAMAVDHGRLFEYPCNNWEDLPQVAEGKGAIKESVEPDEYERRIIDFVSKCPGVVTCKTGFRDQVTGNKGAIDAAAARLIAADEIIKNAAGGFILPQTTGQRSTK